jgi:hypothetical protein
MGRSLLETLLGSSSLALQTDRRRQADRRGAWRGGRRSLDFSGLSPVGPVPAGLARASRYTWVYDHDTLREQYVN